ncbi:4Fe-4S single cluster domain-containing protein [Brachyspira intermedia]|uniref:4Fe-4S single cluster domain-containing protein n=1 Tax=Brachyspira intermedia TaxID=84377 RepID=UPI0030058923
MRIAHINNSSSIYGFGNSFVIWTQGCKLKCKGCWNESMHDFKGGIEISINDLIQNIKDSVSKYNIDNVTILGGEPLEQLKELLILMANIKKLNLGIILYTGYEKNEIESSDKIKIMEYPDILISGRYIEEQRNINNHLYGSENQLMEFLTDRYKKEDIINGTYVEINIDENGSIDMYGYPDDFFDLLYK